MDKRKRILLNCIIKEYIKSAQPIGSNLLADISGLNLSPATIRNEMVDLEEADYIYQPYTSAGRIPTEKGYRFYIENFLEDKQISKKKKELFKKIKEQFEHSHEDLLKKLAKLSADLSKETILVGFSPNNVYYTGITNLFSQPEFREYNLIYSISEVLDHFDELVEELFHQLGGDIKVLIGKENPFSELCSIVLTKYKFSPQQMEYLEF